MARLTEATEARIRKLAAETNRSVRSIAAEVGMSRGTVHRVLVLGRHATGLRSTASETLLPDAREGQLGRCPTCHARVHLPCRACMVRRLAAAAATLCVDPAELPPLRIRLRGAARRRYLALRRRKIARAKRGTQRPPAPRLAMRQLRLFAEPAPWELDDLEEST